MLWTNNCNEFVTQKYPTSFKCPLFCFNSSPTWLIRFQTRLVCRFLHMYRYSVHRHYLHCCWCSGADLNEGKVYSHISILFMMHKFIQTSKCKRSRWDCKRTVRFFDTGNISFLCQWDKEKTSFNPTCDNRGCVRLIEMQNCKARFSTF